MPAPTIQNLALAIELAKYLRPGAYLEVPQHGRVTRVPRGVTLCTREGCPVKLAKLDRANAYVLMDAFAREGEKCGRKTWDTCFRWAQIRLLSDTTLDPLKRVVPALPAHVYDPAWAKARSEGWRPEHRAWDDPRLTHPQLPPSIYHNVSDKLRDALLAPQPLSTAVCAPHKLDAIREDWCSRRTGDRDLCWSERSMPFVRAGVTPWSPVCTALRRKNVERYIYDPRLETSPSESRVCTVHGMRPLNTVACKVREGRPYQRRCWFGVAEGFAWTPVCATIWARVEPMVDLQARCSTAHYRGLRKHSTMGIEERLEREKYWWKYVCEWVPRRARCEFDSRALLYVPCLSLDRAQGRYPYGNGIRCTASRPREWGSNGLAPWAEPWTHRSSGDSL